MLWKTLHDDGDAPDHWGEANLRAHNFYEHHMCRKFPELSYGKDNWKAHMIATDSYPSWFSSHVGSIFKVKSEPPGTTCNRSLKRSPSPSPLTSTSSHERKHKKVKVAIPVKESAHKPQEPISNTSKVLSDSSLVCSIVTDMNYSSRYLLGSQASFSNNSQRIPGNRRQQGFASNAGGSFTNAVVGTSNIFRLMITVPLR